MRRISAIFVAVCMVLIAGSLGAVLYLGLKLNAEISAIAALAALAAMALYNAVSTRLRDRSDLGDQIADLSRGSADLARQVAELSRRFNSVEGRVEFAVTRARATAEPLAAEIGELGGLVKQLAESVALHDTELRKLGGDLPPIKTEVADVGTLGVGEPETADAARRFRGLSGDGIAAMVASAIEENRIDLYLQPIVTLPQRKVRYYEALSRLRTEDGELLPAGDFIEYAEAGGLMPKLDTLMVFRCVQVLRRLQMKNRDIGLFCNLSAGMLSNAAAFKQFFDFMDANRALASTLMFEFSQNAYRQFGAIEQESLAVLADRGFHFSMDHVADLRMEPKELAAHGFRFLKVPAGLLLNRATEAHSDIHPADLADLLARSGIDLIAEHIENESSVVDLLDYDVRFGQGFLFSRPRPVRAEALQTSAGAEPLQPDGDAPAEMISARVVNG
jgi:cyclic-di-GMP phosphodiesterase, flagellum assembly factor TipF